MRHADVAPRRASLVFGVVRAVGPSESWRHGGPFGELAAVRSRKASFRPCARACPGGGHLRRTARHLRIDCGGVPMELMAQSIPVPLRWGRQRMSGPSRQRNAAPRRDHPSLLHGHHRSDAESSTRQSLESTHRLLDRRKIRSTASLGIAPGNSATPCPGAGRAVRYPRRRSGNTPIAPARQPRFTPASQSVRTRPTTTAASPMPLVRKA